MAEPEVGVFGYDAQAQECGKLPEEGVLFDVALQRSAFGRNTMLPTR